LIPNRLAPFGASMCIDRRQVGKTLFATGPMSHKEPAMKLFGRKLAGGAEPSGDGTAGGQKLERRDVVVGIGVVGAAAVAAQVLPGSAAVPAAAAVADGSSTDAGYRLSAHVQRYYETTKA
jgi:hypothetical protein